MLHTSGWRRIQDSVHHVDKQQDRLIAAAREREAMHLCSKEVVKNWPNTIASALQMTEVLKERERDQTELKKRKETEAEEADKEILAMISQNKELALQQQGQKAVERKQKCLAVAETLKQQ
ncbi:hypothetical protein KOW79_007313 [Hemibagrus wyckioides]|uniref:Uncharacterized protein n=1 Tax=Hemibagrus wyckioides TaxID=337641 RepID=A0A9D3NV28_9TELE|nr:hypothetical protein KOW79_007313 [Hemibagrus wyckioides]